MFRDSRGVVHTVSAADPLVDLPAGAADALAAALLQPGEADLEAALERCEAVRELLERWQDAFFAALPDEVDPAEEAGFAAEAGLSLAELEAAYGEEDDDDADDDVLLLDDLGLVEVDLGVELPLDLEVPEPDEPDVPLPEDLVHLLERELLLLPVRVRLEALVAAAGLVSTWADLLVDHEKLLGHLVLRHLEPVPDGAAHAGAGGHEHLAARHAALHAGDGAGHPATSTGG